MADDFGRGFSTGVSLGNSVADNVTRAMRQKRADRIADEISGERGGVDGLETRRMVQGMQIQRENANRAASGDQFDRAIAIEKAMQSREKAATLETWQKSAGDFAFLLDNWKTTRDNPNVHPAARQSARLKYAAAMGVASSYGEDIARAADAVDKATDGKAIDVSKSGYTNIKYNEDGNPVAADEVRTSSKEYPERKPVGLGNDGVQVDPETQRELPLMKTIPVIDPSDRATYDALRPGAIYTVPGSSKTYTKPR